MAVKSAISGYDEFLSEYEAAKDDELNQLDGNEEYEDELEDIEEEEFANEEVNEPVSPGNIIYIYI